MDFYINGRTPSHKLRKSTTNGTEVNHNMFVEKLMNTSKISVTVNGMTKRTIASSLKAARSRSGLKQQQVADHLGVDRTTIYTWEKGDIMPSLDKALALAKLYKITLSELVGDNDTAINRLNDLEDRVRRIEQND